MNEKEIKEFVLTIIPDSFTFRIQRINRPRAYYVVIQDTIAEIEFHVEIDLNLVSNDKEKPYIKKQSRTRFSLLQETPITIRRRTQTI